jgi:hypothetical protein
MQSATPLPNIHTQVLSVSYYGLSNQSIGKHVVESGYSSLPIKLREKVKTP